MLVIVDVFGVEACYPGTDLLALLKDKGALCLLLRQAFVMVVHELLSHLNQQDD